MFSLRSGDLTLQFIAPTSLVGAGSTTYEMNSNRNTTISVLFDNVRMTRSTLSDADCGAGYVYDASQNATSCAGATCNASGVDRKTCCTQCDAGYYCTGAKLPCGAVGSFCPPGSGRPVPVTSGYFTTPENVSKEMTRESQVRVSYLLFDTLYRCSL